MARYRPKAQVFQKGQVYCVNVKLPRWRPHALRGSPSIHRIA
jgi:hypothetical protein